MLHELLFALSGHSGGIFRDTGDGIRVLGDLPFIHTSEVQLLNDLCRLGTLYRDLQAFVRAHSSALSSDAAGLREAGELHGLYVKALGAGLGQVLRDYEGALLELEREAVSDPHLSLSHVITRLQEYHLLFPALASVVEQIVTHKAHGCYILEILHRHSITGLPIVKSALTRILHSCHSVLLRQLTLWLLHGTLMDSYQEFFIQKADSSVPPPSKPPPSDDNDLGIMGITGRQLKRLLSAGEEGGEEQGAWQQHTIKADLLPSYIPTRVAEKILFVGESVQMFEKERHKSSLQAASSILKDHALEFSKDLHGLSRQVEFNAMAFEAVIDKIRTYVAEYLWRLVVEEADLLGQLRVMKDLFLLGRGELYLTLIDKVHPLLAAPPGPTTQHDVNMAYRQAARNILLEDDALLQRFQLTVTPRQTAKKGGLEVSAAGASSTGAAGQVETGWSCLGLTCSVPWPLHIFFTPAVLQKYDQVFRFLLAVRRSQVLLHHCWLLQMQTKNRSASRQEGTIWQLRNHMSFLVDNLQYYLQVDVMEALFGTLVEKIHATRDFETVKLAHEQFLSALLSQSFVHMKAVFQCLHEILTLCNSFCRLVMGFESPLPAGQLDQLLKISQSFQKQSGLLFKILCSVQSHSTSPHLAQLLLRLDFNKYFTDGRGLGS